MTARSPLYYDGSGSLVEMTSAEVTEWVNQTIFQYGSNPSAVLTRVASSGANMSAIDDTRLKAGNASSSDGNESGGSSAADFPSEGTTQEPQVVTVSQDKINLAYSIPSITSDTGKTFPVYQDDSGGTIRSMTKDDFVDTFCKPAIDLLIAGTTSNTTAGTYEIATSTSLSNNTLVSSSSVFDDTRANTSAYTSGGIPETLDQPTTITSYYLHRRNAVDNSPSRQPLYIDGDNNLREYADGSGVDIEALLSEYIRYVAAGGGSNEYSHQIQYSVGTSGSGNTRGSGMVDTRLNGSGNYQTRQVGNDYRAQEFPNGSPTTIATYNLRITKG